MKKGFTLVEVLAVIIILGIMTAITVPAVQKSINSSKNKLYDVTVAQIIDGAKQYVADNNDLTEKLTNVGRGYVTLSTLISSGFVDDNVKNPKTGDPFSVNAAIKVTKPETGNYKYEFIETGIPQPTIVFNHNFGGSTTSYMAETFRDVTVTSSGYVAVGYSQSTDMDMLGLNKGSGDAIIVKYDNGGNVLWKKSYGGSNWDDFFSVQATTDGGCIALGTSASFDGDMSYRTGTPSTDDQAAIIVKYDADGNITWQKYNVHTPTIIDSFAGVIQVSDGYIAIGTAYVSYYDGIIVKYDLNGNFVWEKRIGGSGWDNLFDIVSVDNGFIVMGSEASTDGIFSGKNKGESDVFVAKYDLSGNMIWCKNYGGSDGEIVSSMSISDNNSIVIVGTTPSNDGDFAGLNKGSDDGFIIKIDDTGNIKWIKCFGGSSSEDFDAIACKTSGECAVAGTAMSLNGDLSGMDIDSTFDDIIVVVYSNNGTIINKTKYGGTGCETTLNSYKTGIELTDDGYIFASGSNSTTGIFQGLNKGGFDAIIFRIKDVDIQ